MACRRLYKPKARSFWTIVRRILLLGDNRKPPPAHPAAAREEEEEKSGLLNRTTTTSSSRTSSLEELLRTDGPAPVDAAGRRCANNEKHGVAMAVGALHRPVMSSEAAGAHRRRFMFGGFRRRRLLLTRTPWRPVLVAIPE